MRAKLLFILFSVILSSAPSYSASPPKIGSNCPKLGITQTYKGADYLCTKSGKKLIWTSVPKPPRPIITVNKTQNSQYWAVNVLNFPEFKLLANQFFSVVVSLDRGIWQEVGKFRNQSLFSFALYEPFTSIELKVMLKQDFKIIQQSEMFSRTFPQSPISSTVSPSPTPKPSASPSLALRISPLMGVQSMNLPTEYIDDKPYARLFFRWPTLTDPTVSGYLLSYENLKVVNPPCDLTKALCEAPKRFDSNIYTIAIPDRAIDKIEVGKLLTDTGYSFSFCAVFGGADELRSATPPKCTSAGRSYLTNTETVPSPPINVTVSSTPGKIEVNIKDEVKKGFKIKVIAIGGSFGIGTDVLTVTDSGKFEFMSPLGLYQIILRTVSPSGISSTSSAIYEVTVKS